MIKRIAIAVFLFGTLSACGNKGPLVMPDPKPVATPADTASSPVGMEADKPANDSPERR